MDKKCYIVSTMQYGVFSSGARGSFAPSYPTLEEARTRSVQLAKQYPGVEMVICEAVETTKAVPVPLSIVQIELE